MIRKITIILMALALALCWAVSTSAAIRDDSRMVAESEVIGQIRLPCGCPGYISFIKSGEYGLAFPAHKEAYKFTVTQEDGKLTAIMSGTDDYRDVYTSVPPYERWWSDNMKDYLTREMLGFTVLDTIRRHYQKNKHVVFVVPISLFKG